MEELRLALAQISSTVGDFEGNRRKVEEFAAGAERAGAQVVVFPELCLTGYPPEDLLLKSEFIEASMEAARALASRIGDVVAVVGFVEGDYDTFNSAAVMHGGELLFTCRKRLLPNYGVFDEKRYFGAGDRNVVLELDGRRLGVTICEDIWYAGGPVEEQVARGGAEVILNLSASPFNRGKYDYRRKLIAARALDGPVVLAYANAVGGQDELVFDGGSCVYHPQHGFLATAARFSEELLMCDVDLGSLQASRRLEPRFRYGAEESARPVQVRKVPAPRPTGEFPPPGAGAGPEPPRLSRGREILTALTVGLSEYARKNGFEHAVLGLSGGIDSAVTAAIAAGALGEQNVTGVFMPSRYTSVESASSAERVASNLGVRLLEIPIDGLYDAYAGALETLAATDGDTTFENIQARIRGNLLMALSNRFGWLVLATGNKSELSMGYCTLYGDMAGGFALIKDLLKTQVYKLASFINESAGRELIPRSVLERPPSAELRAGQLDTDALPPYGLLDPVLEAYIESDLSAGEIVSRGFDRALVESVIRRVDSNEYKRRQAPVGVKLTPRAFGRDWRMPISAGGWKA